MEKFIRMKLWVQGEELVRWKDRVKVHERVADRGVGIEQRGSEGG